MSEVVLQKNKKTKEIHMEEKKNIKRNKSDRAFDAVVFVLLTLIFLMVAYPLYFVIISSISEPAAVAGGQVTWRPIGLNFEGYLAVFKDESIVRGFINSLIYTVAGVGVNLFVTIPTAYALSRDDFYGKKIITMFYMLTMFVSGGLMPTYLVIQSLGMVNTMWALIIPGALSVYNMIVARTFFKTNIPQELLDAAKVDGCGNTRFFFYVCLPLSGAIIAILVLYYGIGHWNSYFNALIYMTDRDTWPLQLVLRTIFTQNSLAQQIPVTTPEALLEKQRLADLAELMKYSLIVVSSIPVMILYPFVQKHFVKGVTLGSVKG